MRHDKSTTMTREWFGSRRASGVLVDPSNRLECLLSDVTDMVAVFDTDGNMLYASPSVSRFVGSPMNTPLSRAHGAALIRFADTQRLRHAFRSWSGDGAIISPVTYTARHCDGSWRQLEAVGRSVVDASGSRSVIVTSRDRTAHDSVHDDGLDELMLRRAIDRQEFVVYYQPEIDITSGELVGVEALARWQAPDRGLIAPDGFIGCAEATGLIVPLGRLILEIACSQMASVHQKLPSEARRPWVSVNVSGRQIIRTGFVEEVAEVLALTDLDPESLWLEITETVLMDDLDASRRAMEALRAIGVHISIDDFGTGWSSLAHLKRFPVEQLKIDQSFIAGAGSDPEDTSIITAVIAMAHALEISVVAEGVETPGQLAALAALGCDVGQGYLWSRPMPFEQLAAWIKPRPVGGWTPDSTSAADLGHIESRRVVESYEDSSFPAVALSTRLAPAFLADEIVIMVAKRGHRSLIEASLTAAGVNLAVARRRGQYLSLDPEDTIARILVDGRVDRARFRAVAGEVIARLDRTGRRVHVCVEAATELRRQENPTEVSLDELWNELHRDHDFTLISARPIAEGNAARRCRLHPQTKEHP